MKKWMLITALALVALTPSLAQTATPTPEATPIQRNVPFKQRTRAEIVQGLIRIGEQAIVRQNDAALDAYFSKNFVFHGPEGDSDLAGLKRGWAASRAAFSDFTISRGRIVVEGNFVASQTTFSGTFVRQLTQSTVGTLPPTGKKFTQNIINIFRYDDDGRLAEEWVQYDNRDYLRQLGAEGR